MKLELQSIWSPDLDTTFDALPSDVLDFDVFVQITVGEPNSEVVGVFYCRVCSVSALANTESGTFICHTLILDKFDWQVLTERVRKLLLHTSSVESWGDAIKQLNPCIEYADNW